MAYNEDKTFSEYVEMLKTAVEKLSPYLKSNNITLAMLKHEISNREAVKGNLIETVSRLEDRIKFLNREIAELEESKAARIEQIEREVNSRFVEESKKIDAIMKFKEKMERKEWDAVKAEAAAV